MKAHLAILSANLIFGVNYALVKYITAGYIQPYGLNVIRVGVSLFLLWSLFLLGKRERWGIQKKHLGLFVVCALTGVFINQTLFIKGMSMTTSIHASLLTLASPIFITIIASWMGLEKMSWLKAIGLVAGISGAVVLTLQKESSGSSNNVMLGDLFVIINAISYAFYMVMVKPLMVEYGPLNVIRWVFTIGFLFTLPFGWNQFSAIDWSIFPVQAYAATAGIVIGATFLAYLFNLYGIHHLGASVTGSYIYTQPVFAALVAIIFMGESYTWIKGIAALLIVAGVLLVSGRNFLPKKK